MRKYLAVLAVLLFCSQAYSGDYYHQRDDVTTKSGYAVSGASVYFYIPNTETTVTAFTDIGGVTPVVWPLLTDDNGEFDCYLLDGNYDVRVVHTGHSIDTTKENYMVGSGSDTLSFSSLDVSGTMSANAFDADDWITAGGQFTGQTLETSGAVALGGAVTTGGAVDIGGDLYVLNQAKVGWDEDDEVYSFRASTNFVSIEPTLQVHDDAYIYANLYLLGKDSSSGKVNAQTVEVDTLKPRTGSDLYVRSADGKDDVVLHTQFLELDPVDVTVSLPDAGLHTKGTFFLGTDDTLRFKNDAGNWATFGTSYVIPDPDVPALYLNPTTLSFTYAEPDSHSMTFGVGNTGDGILSWTASNICTWLATVDDTGTVGAGYDSVVVEMMWAQVDSGASLWDTVHVATDYGNGEILIHAQGKALVGGGDYVVEPNHPRLFFNEDEVAGIRAKCKSAEATFYTGFIDWVDDYALGDTYPFAYNYQHGQQLRRLAFAYAVEQDTTYLQEAVECADSLFAGFPTTWYDDDDVQVGMALFYDWCYDGFGDTRKAKFGDSLAVACSRAHADASYSTNAAHSQIVVMSDLMYMALALAGDGLDDAGATATLDSIYAHTFGDHHMGAILDSIGNDGGGYEGDYSEGTASGVSTLFWLWDHGTDKDPWGSTNMTGHGDYMLYDTGARTEVVLYDVSGPSQNTLYAFGEGKQSDSEAHAGGLGSRLRLVQRLAAAYQDSTLVWLSDQYDTHTTAYQNNPSRWQDLVMRDTLMTAVTPAAAGYTSAKQFDVGTVFMRSGWDLSTGSTDIWATYRHEQYPFGHAHADAGHFILGRGHDLLLVDTGEYYNSTSDHHLSYMKQTIAHNAITIKDFSESFGSNANSGGQDMQGIAYSGEHPLTLGAYTDSMAGLDGRGSITTYAHRADTLTYIKSDLTDAYSSSKVDTVRREFVWMEPDGVFLVFDYADVDSTGFLQKSLFHFINNPTDNGDATWTVVHGTSEATLRFLGNTSVAEVGGAGSEFEVNGTNYPLPSTTDYHSDNGAYRLEAVMSRNVDQRWLLTIIEASVVGGADYGTVSFVTDITDYVGAVVNGDTVLFHRYGGSYQYRAQ